MLAWLVVCGEGVLKVETEDAEVGSKIMDIGDEDDRLGERKELLGDNLFLMLPFFNIGKLGKT